MKIFRVYGGMGVGLAICLVMSAISGGGTKTDHFFLGLMIVIIAATYFSCIRKAEKLTAGLKRGIYFLENGSPEAFEKEARVFREAYLDGKYQEYKESEDQAINNHINLYDMENYTKRNVLELVPDILTSLGILGTFIGLVIGLRGFNPGSYQQMSSTMSPLISGIKVAFLTSIYGIALAVPYSFGLQNLYNELEEAAESFLQKFTAGTEEGQEPLLEMLREQKKQTKILQDMTESLSEQFAESFAEAAAPIFQSMREQVGAMSQNQKEMLEEAAREFAAEFKRTFIAGFSEFEEKLASVNLQQQRYMEFMDQSVEQLRSLLTTCQKSVTASCRANQRSLEKQIDITSSAVTEELRAFVGNAQEMGEEYRKYMDSLEEAIARQAAAHAGAKEQLASFAEELGRAAESYMEAADAAGRRMEIHGQKLEQAVGEIRVMVSETARAVGEMSQTKRGAGNSGQEETLRELTEAIRELTVIEKRREERRGWRRLAFWRSR